VYVPELLSLGDSDGSRVPVSKHPLWKIWEKGAQGHVSAIFKHALQPDDVETKILDLPATDIPAPKRGAIRLESGVVTAKKKIVIEWLSAHGNWLALVQKALSDLSGHLMGVLSKVLYLA
jgi:hypothetical protein